MIKTKWALLGMLVMATATFVACASIKPKPENVQASENTDNKHTIRKSYGAYLAGRVAHLRRDFNAASDYYIQALKVDHGNQELINKIYLILVSKSRVDEAAVYAEKNLIAFPKDNFAQTVVAVKNMHNGLYEQSLNNTKNFDNPAYRNFIAPLLNAWNYVGLEQPEKALKELETLKKEPGFKAIYHFHCGMINDYFNNNREAQKHYEILLNEENLELSLRSLQVISNFYVRTEQKDKAVALVGGINNERFVTDMLKALYQSVKNATPKNTKKIIASANDGSAEALFSIAATFRYDEIIDVAHMFTSLAIYQNPRYDLAKILLADILEDREMYEDANDIYETIEEESPAYYVSRLKQANNLIKISDYNGAELLLKSLALDYDNAQLYLDLGDVLRINNRPQEAIKYYKQAIKTSNDNVSWVLYYALGVSYEQSGDWDKAEKALKKAQKLSNGHYMVLNYLGYTWMKQGKNIDEAVQMIVSAYAQAPSDANIIDSMGWALYNLGYYGMAEKYLEQAAAAAPSNPVISSHLGDVYWFTGRKNEARFQWQHALDLKDVSGEINRKEIETKINDGIDKAPNFSYDKALVDKQLKLISSKEFAQQ